MKKSAYAESQPPLVTVTRQRLNPWLGVPISGASEVYEGRGKMAPGLAAITTNHFPGKEYMLKVPMEGKDVDGNPRSQAFIMRGAQVEITQGNGISLEGFVIGKGVFDSEREIDAAEGEHFHLETWRLYQTA